MMAARAENATQLRPHSSSAHVQMNNSTIISTLVSSPDTKFFARVLRPCRKIGSGHFHYENWGKFTYGGQ